MMETEVGCWDDYWVLARLAAGMGCANCQHVVLTARQRRLEKMDTPAARC